MKMNRFEKSLLRGYDRKDNKEKSIEGKLMV